jgi:anti-anti-sigma factor
MMLRGGNNTNNEKHEFSFNLDERIGTTRRFILKGRVSVNEAAFMERELEYAIQSGCTTVIINMSRVSMFTSAGIRVILAAYKKLKKLGGELKIESPAENVRNVIGMVALDELLLR